MVAYKDPTTLTPSCELTPATMFLNVANALALFYLFTLTYCSPLITPSHESLKASHEARGIPMGKSTFEKSELEKLMSMDDCDDRVWRPGTRIFDSNYAATKETRNDPITLFPSLKGENITIVSTSEYFWIYLQISPDLPEPDRRLGLGEQIQEDSPLILHNASIFIAGDEDFLSSQKESYRQIILRKDPSANPSSGTIELDQSPTDIAIEVSKVSDVQKRLRIYVGKYSSDLPFMEQNIYKTDSGWRLDEAHWRL